MSDQFRYGGAQRAIPVDRQEPLLQWASGLQTSDKRIYEGWFTVAGRYDDLDAACQKAGLHKVTIKHGSGNLVTHWAIPTATMFPIALNIEPLRDASKKTTRHGIAMGWRPRRDDATRSESFFKMLVIEQSLFLAGYESPLLITLSSTITTDMIDELSRQYDVIDAANIFRTQVNKPAVDFPFYAFSIDIGIGKTVSRGSIQSKDMTVMEAKIPNPITLEYCKNHTINAYPAIKQVVESLIDEAVTWSEIASRPTTITPEDDYHDQQHT